MWYTLEAMVTSAILLKIFISLVIILIPNIFAGIMTEGIEPVQSYLQKSAIFLFFLLVCTVIGFIWV